MKDDRHTKNGITVRRLLEDMYCCPNADYLPVVVHCLKCRYVLATGLRRTYVLSEMERRTASQLQNLLYDYNAQDENVQKHVFDRDGYSLSVDCQACHFDILLGTEEVPHPIDKRLHTCGQS